MLKEPVVKSMMRLPIVFILLVLLFLAPIHPTHVDPSSGFYPELCAALAILLLGGFLFAQTSAKGSQERRITLRPSWLLSAVGMLLGVICVRSMGSFWVAWPYVIYGLAFAFAWLCGVALVQRYGLSWVVKHLAWAVFLGALLQCVPGAVQLLGSEAGGWVVPKTYLAIYGNIWQPNHFADLLCLGLLSAWWLWVQGALSARVAVLSGVCLNVFCALSVSRAVWPMIVVPVVIAFLYGRRLPQGIRARVYRGAWVLLGLLVLCQVVVSLPDVQTALGVKPALARIGDVHSNGERWFYWQVAWRAMVEHPLTGVGPALFNWQVALANRDLMPVFYARQSENAHNLFLQLGAELGVLVTLLSLAMLLRWVWLRWRDTASIERLWGIGFLSVIAVHSLVEYPLWYLYFLLPFALVVGVLDGVVSESHAAAEKRLASTAVLDARWFCIPVLLGLYVCWTNWQDYRRLAAAFVQVSKGEHLGLSVKEAAAVDAVGRAVGWESLLAPQAVLLRMRVWTTQTNLSTVPGVAEHVALCEKHLPYRPEFGALLSCGAAYALAGYKQRADTLNAIACGAWPPRYGQSVLDFSAYFYALRGWAPPGENGHCKHVTWTKPETP